ncbi:isocitrate lyase/phosphoenolpyruvate mutase family protein [Bradyrhizobium sp. BR 10261]|uniref:isocitrate lyase/phosphoenolpyruvate mutase family protein n=1 Tax=Bradyrhizobium sp. BR 10261 TaxID=2749992 RepID=UPI001C6523AE|nr:isocitrate lyase/phosphoenolpyruvate mutase family protein [Bradyrhizobium sp. BR 10261]MBW7967357.1 isocitrate lyase/phosphoenolpyruvate mutase family protein [Bradyrhizobium sp. BR 10261]
MTMANRILPEKRRAKLKELLSERRLVRAIEAHSGLSALISSEAAGNGHDSRHFDALWVSSLTSSAARGLPDMELYALERRLELIDEILGASDKPLIVDGDTGGDANAFEYLCARLESAGVSAVVVEDKQHPKRNSLSLTSSHVLEEPETFGRKLYRGRKVLLSPDFRVFARLESLIAGETVEDALLRARIYVDHGAHGVMIHSKEREPTSVLRFLDRFREQGFTQPVICVPTTYNNVRAEELHARGANIVIHANHLLRAAHFAMRQVCRSLLENDRSMEADNMITPVSEIFREVGYDAALARDAARDSVS